MKSNNRIKKHTLVIRIDSQLDMALRKKIIEVFGGFKKGFLSKAVEEAIRLWLHYHSTHTHIDMNRKAFKGEEGVQFSFRSRTIRTALDIAAAFVNREEVLEPELNKVIMEMAGGDKRTVKKYKDILFKVLGVIVPVDRVDMPAGPVILYKVNNVRLKKILEGAQNA